MTLTLGRTCCACAGKVAVNDGRGNVCWRNCSADPSRVKTRTWTRESYGQPPRIVGQFCDDCWAVWIAENTDEMILRITSDSRPYQRPPRRHELEPDGQEARDAEYRRRRRTRIPTAEKLTTVAGLTNREILVGSLYFYDRVSQVGIATEVAQKAIDWDLRHHYGESPRELPREIAKQSVQAMIDRLREKAKVIGWPPPRRVKRKKVYYYQGDLDALNRRQIGLRIERSRELIRFDEHGEGGGWDEATNGIGTALVGSLLGYNAAYKRSKSSHFGHHAARKGESGAVIRAIKGGDAPEHPGLGLKPGAVAHPRQAGPFRRRRRILAGGRTIRARR